MTWLHDWYVTLRHGKETRGVLRAPFDPDDYAEAPRPEGMHDIWADTEGPCCVNWATMEDVCPHDTYWRIMGCNDNPPSYADWRKA